LGIPREFEPPAPEARQTGFSIAGP
jgi:hypothetical protein